MRGVLGRWVAEGTGEKHWRGWFLIEFVPVNCLSIESATAQDIVLLRKNFHIG